MHNFSKLTYIHNINQKIIKSNKGKFRKQVAEESETVGEMLEGRVKGSSKAERKICYT
jgi:hypothetical protein